MFIDKLTHKITENYEQDYLSNDKKKREETEARLKALEVLIDNQTRRRGRG